VCVTEVNVPDKCSAVSAGSPLGGRDRSTRGRIGSAEATGTIYAFECESHISAGPTAAPC